MDLLTALCRDAIGLVFLLAALSKLSGVRRFSDNLTESFAIPARFSRLATWLIAAIELVLALAILCSASLVKPAMLLTLLLMLLFSGALAFRYWYKGPVRCNCFGEQHRTFSAADLMRNVLLLCAIAGYLLAPAQPLAPEMRWPVLSIAFALTLMLIYLHEVTELLLIRGEYD